MSLPPLAPIPPLQVRLSLGPEEWEACLDAWLSLSEMTLSLSAQDFDATTSQKSFLLPFLNSFYHELTHLAQHDVSLSTPKAIQLRRLAFKLTSRGLLSTSSSLIDWDFLSSFCRAHMRSSALSRLMNTVWQAKSGTLIPILQAHKTFLTTSLESKDKSAAAKLLNQLAPVIHASVDIGGFFMTGSDFLDALISSYRRSATDGEKKALSTVTHLCLLSLARAESPNISALSDHLYTLRTAADKSSPSLLSDVITNTTLLARLRQPFGEKPPERLVKLLDALETYRTPSVARPRKHVRWGKGKGKQKLADAESHMHQMSLVTQVQDLFPDLGSGFVLKLLDEYKNDVEQVTAHLLDESLPAHLSGLDRTEQAAIFETDSQSLVNHLAPRSTPPAPEPFIPERRNVFDGDELDRLEFDTKRLRIGKQRRSTVEEDEPNKAAILSALAAFDSDDDERDDTYDVEDVGGTVDTSHPDGEPGPASKVTNEGNDMALFTTYKETPELFGRTFDIRSGQARQALKAQTGMTDEAIEGWAIMLQRDPKRAKRLESQAMSFDGRQTELASTAFRGSAENTETEDSDAPGGRGGFQGRGRGRGGRGRGRGGNVAGPSNDASTAQAQRRKEANKGSRANHNRREGRARKMARGGFAG